MATIDARLLAQLVGLPDDRAVPLVLHFATNDGVRAATGPLRRLGFVAQAATPTTVAGWLPAGAVERLANVPGLAAVSPSLGHRPR